MKLKNVTKSQVEEEKTQVGTDQSKRSDRKLKKQEIRLNIEEDNKIRYCFDSSTFKKKLKREAPISNLPHLYSQHAWWH